VGTSQIRRRERIADFLPFLAVGAAMWFVPMVGATELPPDLALEVIDNGLDNPVWVGGAGDDSGRLFVVEQPGIIKIVGVGIFLDISDRVDDTSNEQGLLGLAFHPDFADNGYFYVNYTHDPDGPGADLTRVSRFSVSAVDDDVADAASETILMAFSQNESNHNGGDLHFGPDGYLYIATGDGGGSEDVHENAQDLTTPLGKILRIDVDTGQPYSVPSDNPFIAIPNAVAEIWSYGLRNPWRFSFDRATGDLLIGDVGQYDIEEIDFQPSSSAGGENYGWSCMEGNVIRNYHPCDGNPLSDPVLVYDHGLGCSVTGGFVYRGNIGGLHGSYVFGDYCTGTIWIAGDGQMGWTAITWISRGFGLSSFGEDDDGELYLCDRNDGEVYRIVSPSAIFTDLFEFANLSRWSDVVGLSP
jgi:glucose/arabinose dehydrogenase